MDAGSLCDKAVMMGDKIKGTQCVLLMLVGRHLPSQHVPNTYTGTSAMSGLVSLTASYTAAGSALYTIAATDTSAIHHIPLSFFFFSHYTLYCLNKHVKYLKKI